MSDPNPLEISKEEYVVRRFENIPKEVVCFFGLDKDEDAKVILEIAFRAEYFRRRHDDLERILLRAYRKYRAAEIALSAYTDDPAGEICAELEDCENLLSKIKEVPTEF